MKRYRGYKNRIDQPRPNGLPFWLVLLVVTAVAFMAVILWPVR